MYVQMYEKKNLAFICTTVCEPCKKRSTFPREVYLLPGGGGSYIFILYKNRFVSTKIVTQSAHYKATFVNIFPIQNKIEMVKSEKITAYDTQIFSEGLYVGGYLLSTDTNSEYEWL